MATKRCPSSESNPSLKMPVSRVDFSLDDVVENMIKPYQPKIHSLSPSFGYESTQPLRYGW